MVCSACKREGCCKNNRNCPFFHENRHSTGRLPGKNMAENSPGPWKDSKARAVLKSLFVNDDESRKFFLMSAEDLQKLKPCFQTYSKGQFKGYVLTLKNEVLKVNNNWPSPWDKSEAMDDAKSLLLNNSDGTYQSMNVETFWNISPLFQEYPLEYFEKYYSKMKDSVVASKKIIVKEEAFLRHDWTLIPQQSTSKGGNP